jgi:hypothetical protein
MKKKVFIQVALLLMGIQSAYADHTGDYYDNCDDNHAQMSIVEHPGLTYMSTTKGIQDTVIPGKIVFGNASLAVTSGDYWASMNRYYHLRSSGGMSRAYNLYINNNAYWYPEHRDHDDVDYYFTQSATLNNSQGSSGSEIDEMHKWFYTLNAFNAATKSILTNQKLIIPTMQMLARRSRVASDAEYLTGGAHPNVFDNASNQGDMIAMATAMTASEIPPMVKIEVLEEDYDNTNNGIDFFEPNYILKENMYETPVSITRVFHGPQYTKRVVVSAESSYDANSLPLTYHWAVLRGNPSHVRINPLNGSGSQVEIEIDYHEETTIPGSATLTNLVSVGAFVHNGHYYSAPAFITSYTKRNETRTYNTTTDKLESVVYNEAYLDPYISIVKDWDSDVFTYDGSGNLAGWIRQKGVNENKFTKEGYVVETEDISGNPISVSKVYYTTENNKTVWRRNGEPFSYPEVECTSWTYDEWSVCQDNQQYRNVINAQPESCVGGEPIISRECQTSFQARADTNEDLNINSTDAMLVIRNSLGLSMGGTEWSSEPTAGDVNCDGNSNSTDAMLILRYSLGLDMSGTEWCE